jgi:membrane protease YdiL (CAAX protease family)
VILLTGNGYMVSWTPRFTANTVLYLFVFIIVGFAEELLTRGYVMSVLRQTKCMPLVIATSSVLFSLMHIKNNSFSLIPFINIVLAGLLFAYMFIKSGSIWMPIGYHITWNYFQGCVYGFPVSGHGSQGIFNMQYASDTILNGGAFGPEGGLVVTIVLIVSFMFIKWYFRNSTFQFMDMDTPAALQALYRKVEHDNNKEHFGIKKNDSGCAKRFIY